MNVYHQSSSSFYSTYSTGVVSSCTHPIILYFVRPPAYFLDTPFLKNKRVGYPLTSFLEHAYL